MIVPAPKLILSYGLIVPALSLTPLFAPGAAGAALAAGVLLVLIAVLDAAGFGLLTRGLRVSLPPGIRMTKDRAGSLEIGIQKGSSRIRKLRLGPALPESLECEQPDQWIILPDHDQDALLNWSCTPRRRGRFFITACHLETPSLLGLWGFRWSVDTECELRVYPNLARERKSLAALFQNRALPGAHTRRQVGKGRDFEKLREYIPGDSPDEIHWKATAKRRHPITKVFQIERTQEIYTIIDASRLSGRMNDQQESYLERMLGAGLILGLAAQKQGDHFGLLTFSERVHAFVRAGSGKNHFGACREQIVNLVPSPVNPDFEELFTFIRLKLRRRALLIVLTNLDDPVLAQHFLRSVSLVSRQHLVIAGTFLPPGVQPVFSDPAVTSTEDIASALGGQIIWRNLAECARSLKHQGVHLLPLDQENPCLDLVNEYLSVKGGQLL